MLFNAEIPCQPLYTLTTFVAVVIIEIFVAWFLDYSRSESIFAARNLQHRIVTWDSQVSEYISKIKEYLWWNRLNRVSGINTQSPNGIGLEDNLAESQKMCSKFVKGGAETLFGKEKPNPAWEGQYMS